MKNLEEAIEKIASESIRFVTFRKVHFMSDLELMTYNLKARLSVIRDELYDELLEEIKKQVKIETVKIPECNGRKYTITLRWLRGQNKIAPQILKLINKRERRDRCRKTK